MKSVKRSKRRKNIKLFCYIVLLAAMLATIILLNKSGLNEVKIINRAIAISSLSGVVTVFMMLVSLIILNIDNKKGFAATMIINGLQLLSVSYSVFFLHNMGGITGVPMSAGILGLLCMQHNHIKKIEQNEQRLNTLSATDSLTGLNNRRSIMDYVNGKIEANEPFSLIFFDLDNFKNINDSMGHACGDAILCETAKRCMSVADENVYLSRIGGDEFAMIVSGKSDEEIKEFAERFLGVISEKICLEQCDYYATCSIGSARFPQDGTDCESLFRFADTAMYKAKSSGKNRICFFDEEMLSEINTDMKIENEIRAALKYNRFYLVFQPQFETETKQLRGFEALLRLKDESGAAIPPSKIIPVAEKSGLILEIDRWVLRHATQSFAELLSGGQRFIVSVNISAKHITDCGFADEIKKILDETGFPSDMLEIEVTESCFISSIDKAVETLLQIKELGVRVALDDFGTGYASLRYLQRLPIDLLKIDKSFIDDIFETNDSANFVEAIISIGHMFNCEVISEGVEHTSQLEILKKLNCDYIQGYIWGKPQEHSTAVQLIGTQASQLQIF